MNGCQLLTFTYLNPNAITRITIATLTYTITLLNRADSLIPTTNSVVISPTSTTAGTLIMPPGTRSSALAASFQWRGAWVSARGIVIPSSFMPSEKYPAQPTATVAAPNRYSRMRSHPMINAMSSPSVAYAYVYALPAIGIIAANSA